MPSDQAGMGRSALGLGYTVPDDMRALGATPRAASVRSWLRALMPSVRFCDRVICCDEARRYAVKLCDRRRFLQLALGTFALSASSRLAWAQAYPTRPISLVVPFAAGGSFDVIARIITPRLSEILGQQVIVENIGAAAGIVASTASRTPYRTVIRCC
jgi:hypothetical protein